MRQSESGVQTSHEGTILRLQNRSTFPEPSKPLERPYAMRQQRNVLMQMLPIFPRTRIYIPFNDRTPPS